MKKIKREILYVNSRSEGSLDLAFGESKRVLAKRMDPWKDQDRSDNNNDE